MKHLFFLFVAAFAFQTQLAFGDENACQQQYNQSVSTCAQSLASLDKSIRPGAQKGCVKDAQAARAACEAGPSACVLGCDATYASQVAYCNQNFNTTACLGDQSCIDFVQMELTNCTQSASDALNYCTNVTCATAP